MFRRPRKWIRKDVNVAAFFKALNRDGARYVLLRWWQDYPAIESDEDLDILVHRDDYHLIDRFLTDRSGGQRCDVYFHVGAGGNRRRKIPYFPQRLANDILLNRQLHKDAVFVPAPLQYFASLAFHALFHKGSASGIPGMGTPADMNTSPEHDYRRELAKAARLAEVEIAIEARALFGWLAEKGYAPPLDMLGKLADKNPELIGFASLPEKERWQREGELMLFVVRQAAGADPLFMSRLAGMFERARIEVITRHRLDDAEIKRCSRLRGNNWGKGPYWKSAGLPHTFLICYDWYPKPASRESGHALLLNANLTELKYRARALHNGRRLPWNRCNPVHTPDNELEVREYLEVASPALAAKGIEESERRKKRFGAGWPVIEVLSEGRRSRTELVRFDGTLAVQKTFKLGFEPCCDNERAARERFADKVPMPKILHAEEGRIVMEYFSDRTHLVPDELPAAQKPRVAGVLMAWIRAFWEEGYFHADFSPRNILVAQDGSLAMIDFEFLQRYRGLKPDLWKAYEFEGVSPGSGYHLPVTRRPKCIRHHENWRALPFARYMAPLLAP